MTNHNATVTLTKNQGRWTATVEPQQTCYLEKNDTITLKIAQPQGASAEFLTVNIGDREPTKAEDWGKDVPGMRSDNRSSASPEGGRSAGAPGWWGVGPGTKKPDGIVKVKKWIDAEKSWIDIYEIHPETDGSHTWPVIKDVEREHTNDDTFHFWGTVLIHEQGGQERRANFDPEMVNKGTGG